METILEGTNLARRAFWLVELRWLAIALLLGSTFAAHNVLGIHLNQQALYLIAGSVALYNGVLFVCLKRITGNRTQQKNDAIARIIFLQVCGDLLILTAILYFSGSVENPFWIFFVFHMIIASMLLSRRLSYMQATLAVVLFGMLLGLEYKGIIHHYNLKGFVSPELYRDGRYIFGVFFVFAVTMYLVVYMTTSIVAQLRRQQEGYRLANEKLRQNDRVKNEYIMRVTHDVKAHLAAIKSCLEIVAGGMVGPLNDAQAGFIGRAEGRTGKCIAFVVALLKLTRMRLAGTIEKEVFPLRGAIENAIGQVEDKAGSRGIRLSATVETGVGGCFGNELLIEETIANLLLNAIKYTPAGGSVELAAKDQGNTYLVQMTDTGIGVPADEINRIFDEFYRASNARKVERDGTGLGLSLAKEVIERHGGKIWAESGPGGSTFSFTLPRELPAQDKK